jgi:hypothetical protein
MNEQEQLKRWDERFFQLVKEQGQTALTIIIAAASVVVFHKLPYVELRSLS